MKVNIYVHLFVLAILTAGCLLTEDGLKKNSDKELVAPDSSLVTSKYIPNSASDTLAASIVGIVRSVDSGDPLPGVTLLLKYNHKIATTDVNGYFAFPELPLNLDSLKVSFMGYQTLYSDILVTNGFTLQLDVKMKESLLLLDDEAITL